MTVSNSYFGVLSSFVPQVQANLLVMFAKDPKKYKYLQYCDIRKADAMRFYYPVLGNVDVIRDLTSAGVQSEDVWQDGEDNPANNKTESETVQFAEGTCVRYSRHDRFGYLTVEQAKNAKLNILDIRSTQLASKAAMKRTNRIATVLTTTANWTSTPAGTFTDTMTDIAGGQITAATSTNPYIRTLFTDTVTTIIENTNNAVDGNDICAVMNPNTAKKLFQSQEVIDFTKQSPAVYEIIAGEGNWNKEYWLPPSLFGTAIYVDGTVKTTTEQGLTPTRAFSYPDGDIVFLSKKDAINPLVGGAFSTFSLFAYQDFSIELQDDVINKRYLLNVIDNTAEVLVAPQGGYLVTACY